MKKIHESTIKAVALGAALLCFVCFLYGSFQNMHPITLQLETDTLPEGAKAGVSVRFYSAWAGISALPESESSLGLALAADTLSPQVDFSTRPSSLTPYSAAAFEGLFYASTSGEYSFDFSAPAGFLLRIGNAEQRGQGRQTINVTLEAGYQYFYLFVYATNKEALSLQVYKQNALLDASGLFYTYSDTNAPVSVQYLKAEKVKNPSLNLDVPFIMRNNTATGLVIGKVQPLVLTYAATLPLYCNGEKVVSGVTAVDFSRQNNFYFLKKNGTKTNFKVTLQQVDSDLPAIFINTLGGKDAGGRNYEHATVEIMGGDPALIDYAIPTPKVWAEVKGRGNFTFGLEKKPYQLKFYNPTSVLGLPAERYWCLIPSHTDTSLERNKIAYDIAAEFEHLAFTPRARYIDVYLNGDYRGLYLLVDNLTVGPNRLNLKTDVQNNDFGFLLEMEGSDRDSGRPNIDYFQTGRWNIKYKQPDTDTLTPAQRKKIKDQFIAVQRAIEQGGDWKSLIDMDTFIDWYMIVQVFKCWDAQFGASIYFYADANGKLCMGPIWDYDQCMGNQNMSAAIASPRGWEMKEGTWFVYLLKDEEFRQRFIARYFEKRELLGTIPDRLRAYMHLIKKSYDRNFIKYPLLGVGIWPNTEEMVKADTQEKQVQLLIDWIERRLQFMDDQLSRGLT